MAATSAAKKRLSKRNGRFGGVMARAMKWIALRSGTIPALANACQAPGGCRHGARTRDAEHEAGLFVGLAHRRQRESRGLGERLAA